MNKRPRLDSSYFGAQDSHFQHGNTLQSPTDSSQQNQPSAEVAADFKDSLQDLTMNNRYEISNLTVIAKESTEHAMAISKVLEDHIRTAAPPRKLPALYVLDSIVKNVGTPYTIYFGQNLYRTFMDAYTLVDGQTRKSMEYMLKTWKEPTPGSMENRPVFAPEVTRSIENALIKARTLVVQQQQQQAKSQRVPYQNAPPPHAHAANLAAQGLYRNTPTPPQHEERRSTPIQQARQQYPTPTPAPVPTFHQFNQPGPSHSPFPAQPQQQPYYQPPPQPPYSSMPVNPTSPAPIDLAALLKAVGGQASVQPPPPPPPPQMQQGPASLAALSFPGLGALFQTPTPTNFTPQPPPPPPPPSAQAPAMAASQFSTPTPMPAQLVRSPLPWGAGGVAVNDVKLTVASLKIPRAGLVSMLYEKQTNQCNTCARRFGASENGKARKGRHLDWHFRTNMRLAEAARKGVTREWYMDELEWIKSREIDEADEAAVAAAYGKQSAENDDEGSADYGVGSSNDRYGAAAGSSGSGSGGAGTAGYSSSRGGVGKKRERYVKAPMDAAIAHHACPICQEEFRTVWHESAQEWVWMDAVNAAGGKVYHASCMEELAKDRGSTPTPAATRAPPSANANASASLKAAAAASNEQRSGSLKRELPFA